MGLWANFVFQIRGAGQLAQKLFYGLQIGCVAIRTELDAVCQPPCQIRHKGFHKGHTRRPQKNATVPGKDCGTVLILDDQFRRATMLASLGELQVILSKSGTGVRRRGKACWVMGTFTFFPFGQEAIRRKEVHQKDGHWHRRFLGFWVTSSGASWPVSGWPSSTRPVSRGVLPHDPRDSVWSPAPETGRHCARPDWQDHRLEGNGGSRAQGQRGRRPPMSQRSVGHGFIGSRPG